jgi:hypothetical protein
MLGVSRAVIRCRGKPTEVTMSARLTLIAPIALGLLLAPPSLAADERPAAVRGPQPDHAPAPSALAQARPQQEPMSEGSGTEWTRSFTGRQIPDPTGTRFSRPAFSGGTGVTASW